MDQPVPLSFPSILTNPRLKHLQTTTTTTTTTTQNHPQPPASYPDQPQIRPTGRRRRRRSENAQFTSNPHIARPAPADYQLWTMNLHVRFPIRPPRGYPSSLYIPPAEAIPVDGFSARMGAFSRSLKGVRRAIRPLIRPAHQCLAVEPGPVEQALITIDAHLAAWIDSRTVWKSSLADLSPTLIDPTPWPPPAALPRNLPPTPQQPSIVEISRSPAMLSWDIPSSFTRYLVHCVARYYGIVSFSRHQPVARPARTEDPEEQEPTPQPGSEERRIVCMIKAHFPTSRGSQRVDGHQTLDTPPATDLDSELSAVELVSEEESGLTTDDERPSAPSRHALLASIDERHETDDESLPKTPITGDPARESPAQDAIHTLNPRRSSPGSVDADADVDEEAENGGVKEDQRAGRSPRHRRVANTPLAASPAPADQSDPGTSKPPSSVPDAPKTSSPASSSPALPPPSPCLDSNPSLSLNGRPLAPDPPHPLPHSFSSPTKATPTARTDMPLNFLEWVRS